MNLIAELLGMQDIRCFAHTWDLAFKEALNSSETLKVRFRQEIESRFTPRDELIAKSPAILSSILNPQFKEGSHLDKKMKKLAFNEIKDQMKGINVLKSTEIVRVDTEQVSDNSDSEVLFQRKKVKLSAMEKIFWKYY